MEPMDVSQSGARLDSNSIQPSVNEDGTSFTSELMFLARPDGALIVTVEEGNLASSRREACLLREEDDRRSLRRAQLRGSLCWCASGWRHGVESGHVASLHSSCVFLTYRMVKEWDIESFEKEFRLKLPAGSRYCGFRERHVSRDKGCADGGCRHPRLEDGRC